MNLLRSIAFIGLTATGFSAVETTPPLADLFDNFGPGWRDQWQEERFFTKPTQYETVTDAGQTVLHATSRAAHAGLVRKIIQPYPTAARLRWSWKIAAPLTANHAERTRSGDDYAVRVFVVFETSVIPFRTRALNYVWAAHEPVGSIYPSPYTKNVGMIVLRTGEAEAGRWCREERDVLADYEKFFGTPPTQISAVAILVDTDNTGLNAEAWLADLRLDPRCLPKSEKP